MLITHVKQKTNPKYLDILKVLPQLKFGLLLKCHDTIPYYSFGSKEKCHQFHLDNVTMLSNNTMFLFSKRKPELLFKLFGLPKI